MHEELSLRLRYLKYPKYLFALHFGPSCRRPIASLTQHAHRPQTPRPLPAELGDRLAVGPDLCSFEEQLSSLQAARSPPSAAAAVLPLLAPKAVSLRLSDLTTHLLSADQL